ncbi:putative AAA family ATPase/60S ribosome export protein Rix7 [Xylona heveae TC161]|uniref:Peroxisomal ATPase PEX1 n=1 Tax=Xylona heveae (strain CBS 132557 / TC161) TaxID=1328760 RepID=A0A165IXX7_XYLHT|nr:putative AAA family ATPase/60S ribosome export protein Rix7 [Xylona heveae TC161]KZF25526.1 putative AAA family ATPase/60S ribosome export protein Rix7 [Xylona heveae TC161]
MPARPRGGRPTLGHGLDKEIYQIVRKFIDEQSQYDDGRGFRLTSSTVYDRIKRSNSSLNRKSKKLLEDSIERVIAVIKEETADDDPGSIDGEFDGLEDPEPEPEQEPNSMNKSIVAMWGSSKPQSEAASPAPGQTPPSASSKKRERQTNGEPLKKKRRVPAPAETVDRSPPTHVSLADFGGVDSIIQDLEDLLVLPLLRPQIYSASKIQPPRGILLHGPPGCGKTMIANAFASEIGIPFIPISAPSIVSGMSGESEKQLREFFEEAKRMAPCLMFIDEIDAITPKRESAQREMEKRIVAQLLTCMDDLALEKTDGKAVIVLAATNRPDALDPALRRGGRFDKEINLSVPNEAHREQILRALTRDMRLHGDFDFRRLAKMTPGFVGADLNDLVATAGSAAIKRYLDLLKSSAHTHALALENGNDMELDDPPVSTAVVPAATTTTTGPVDDEGAPIVPLKVRELREIIAQAKEPFAAANDAVSITHEDFLNALPKIQPSSKREGFATVPDTTWEDIGALQAIREELQTAIVEPIRNPEMYEQVGITAPAGVLLWGPPGCGKTLLARAVANESKANFISVKGPELLNKYVGESERSVRQVFVRARSSIPCVIFFDELDALVPRRDESLSEASARVVNTLLTELDGLSSRQGIYVIAATNRPDIIDPAMLRPGRLETLLFVGLPGPDERVEILAALLQKLPVADESQRGAIAEVALACHGFSGADLESLLRRAGYSAVKARRKIALEDFHDALKKVRPSVSDLSKYEKLRGRLESGDAI